MIQVLLFCIRGRLRLWRCPPQYYIVSQRFLSPLVVLPTILPEPVGYGRSASAAGNSLAGYGKIGRTSAEGRALSW